MPYAVHSEHDRERMLETVGASSTADLFAQIPAALCECGLQLPSGLSEQETRAQIEALAAADRVPGAASFLGAGYYRHFVPAAVRALVSRTEFATAYTPYQPEVSQGTLEHIFEFQTCVCEITGMDVANASLYDGPSALAEGAFMALRATRREAIAVSVGIHPEARLVLATYASGPSVRLRTLPLDPATGATAMWTQESLPAGVGAVLVQQPNYLGVIEDLEPLAESAHANGALLVVSVNPATLGLLETPGALGADIVVGDAQVFGCPPTFGGPSVGFLACREEHVRQIPGRLVSQTVDEDGLVCYTLTLQAREQHIRRAKATSNICSNQALSALAATIHLALLGPAGLRERAEICLRRAHHLHSRLCSLPGVRPLVDGPFFHEFALRLPCPAEDFALAMRARGVDPGVPLARLWRGQVAERLQAAATGAGDETPGDLPTENWSARDFPAEQAPAREAPTEKVPAEEALLVAVTELNSPEVLAEYVEKAAGVLASLGASRADGVSLPEDRGAATPTGPALQPAHTGDLP